MHNKQRPYLNPGNVVFLVLLVAPRPGFAAVVLHVAAAAITVVALGGGVSCRGPRHSCRLAWTRGQCKIGGSG